MALVTRILAQYRELLLEVDEWFSRCSLAVREQIACRRGCSACCRGLFDITLLDACLLHDGFTHLSRRLQLDVISKARSQLHEIRQHVWPDFSEPWLLNSYPEQEWNLAMPEEDETPCPLLGADGLCLVYHHRPMTCRLHGIPLIDSSGEILFDEWCSLNFTTADPLTNTALRAPLNDIFKQEQLLFREFSRCLTGTIFNELDTLIPAAVLIDYSHLVIPASPGSQSSS